VQWYFLHRCKTKAGKHRYFFATTIRQGALAEMPDGFECVESINGVVSVRKKVSVSDSIDIPEVDVRIVETELAKHQHLRYHKVRVEKGAIIIFEPNPREDELLALGTGIFGFTSRAFIEERMAQARYAPVMKFERVLAGDKYSGFRMTYRGKGGWSWPLKSGKLSDIVEKLIKNIGTEGFFELF